jgi:medium-chain acyl-[acyl-carrier-protein] hydrolase
VPVERPDATLRLFCLPYAGGGAWVYSKWQEYLPASIEVCPIYLPGREISLHEAPFVSMPLLVEDLARAMLPYLDKQFVLFGHSMGALVGFETARQLAREFGVEPAALFVSGCSAPQVFRSTFQDRDRPTDDALNELCRCFNIQKSLLINPELFQLISPTLQADLDMCRRYSYVEEPALDYPIVAFGGLQDSEVACRDLEAWRSETSCSFSLHMFSGGHFFLHTDHASFLTSLAEELVLFPDRVISSVSFSEGSGLKY